MNLRELHVIEEKRLKTLLDYQILDTCPEREFDSITRLASYICKTPFALITFLDDQRQWVKSSFGVPLAQTPLHEAFCTYTIQGDLIFQVKDSLLDSRFFNNPLVHQPPHIRFYAGAPLISPEGFRIGAICVLNTGPGDLCEEQQDALKVLAGEVISHLEMRKKNRQVQDTLMKYEEIYNMFDSSAELHCVMDRETNILRINRTVEKLLGYTVEEAVGHPIWQFLPEGELYKLLPVVEEGLRNKLKNFDLETRVRTKAGELKWVSWSVTVDHGKWYANGRDITYQKNVVEELEMLSLVASKVDNGVIISSTGNNVIWANEAFERITGYNMSDLKGHKLGDILQGEKTDIEVLERARECTRNKLPFAVDLLAYRKNGEPMWISVINSVILNSEGEVDKVVEVIIDITARKKAEEELETLSLVASKSSTGVVIRNAQGDVSWVNEALTDILGFKSDELVGKPLGDKLIGEKTQQDVLDHTSWSVANKKPYSVELLVYKKDKTPIWIFCSSTPILDGKGELERQVEIIVDITERKFAEEQLTLLSLVASKTMNGVVISDRAGNVKWVNEAFEQLSGYKLEEVVGKKAGEVTSGNETNQKQLEYMRAQTIKALPSTIEVLLYKKDKTPVWVSVSNTPTFNSDGSFDQQVAIINDISERKLFEQELIKTREEALQLSKAKEAFLSVMSHEIRTPLNAVIGITHILMDDNPTEAQMENLKILNFSSQNLLSLINDVLDFTKIETGHMLLEKAEVNLKDLVSQTLNTLQFKTAENGVILKSEIDHRIPLYVKGDHTRLYQILINLLGNAVKFTEEGEIKLKLDLVAEDKKSVKVSFEISDTGIGIQQDKIDYIFDTYTQANSDTARKYGGTGLGLAITKRLVELHHSKITVLSEIGKGSTFSFTIEFDRSEQEIVAVPGKSDPILINSTILVVDDNYINRILAQKVLSKWGITVEFAENGQIALEKVQKTPYDMVLMDLQMPVMDGIEAAKAIRSLDGDYFRKLPIIALTASLLSQERMKVFDCGIDDFIMKPFIPAVLFEKIRSYLVK
jgi:PAS domain S-box-containing protein